MANGNTAPIESTILVVRNRRVMLASDLAKIYGVETRVLNQAVKRNRDRFPEDFTFRLTGGEASAVAASRSQSVILKRGGNIKYLPYVFTEHGAIMAANVLNSPHAVRMSVYVVRAFIRLGHGGVRSCRTAANSVLMLASCAVSARSNSANLDIMSFCRSTPQPKKRKIGFLVEEKAAAYGRR
jgi:ORF6N domain